MSKKHDQTKGWGDGARLGRSVGPDTKVMRDARVGAKRKERKLKKATIRASR